jgi:prepilin-type N-terminal cleavage/methylation domain-containing protein
MMPATFPRRRARRGFTLIELLVVIAIIALLAAILFPVFSSVRERARMGQCQTNLMQISHGLAMYKDDWKAYPEALYGLSVSGGPLSPRLFGHYVKDGTVFTCPNHPSGLKTSTALVTPTNPMTNANAVDAFGRPIAFQQSDSYDFQFHPNNPSGKALLNYTTHWSVSTNAAADDPRQLYRREPPGTTVVTWCLYHSNMDANGVPAQGTQALVLFLGGNVKNIPAQKLANWAGPNGNYPWQVTP